MINVWSTTPVDRCLERLNFGRKSKILKRDYKVSGEYPIVDQGQGLIAGWTDDPCSLISTHLPLIVFGDHTRTFKYIDFPFVRGADGTQLLKPKAGIDPLFFYYACRGIDLPSRGYNRHFKALKEKRIPTPPLGEQHNIARTLRWIDDAISLQDKQLQVTTDMKQTAMRTLFTHGLKNEPQKETEIGSMPESWETLSVADSVRPYRFDRNIQVPKSAYAETGYWPIIDQGQEFIAGYIDDQAQVIRSETPIIIFGDHTRIFKFVDFEFALGAQGTKPLLAEDGFDPKYLYHALTNLDVPARGYNRHYTLLSQMLIGKPKLDEQREIVAILDTIDRKIDLHQRKCAVLDDLFKALLHKLMTGEIRVGELDLSALQLTHDSSPKLNRNNGK